MSRTLPVKKAIRKRKSTRPVCTKRIVNQAIDPMVAFDLAFENADDAVALYAKITGPVPKELKSLGTWSGTAGEWYVAEIQRRHVQQVITHPSVIDYDCHTRGYQPTME